MLALCSINMRSGGLGAGEKVSRIFQTIAALCLAIVMLFFTLQLQDTSFTSLPGIAFLLLGCNLMFNETPQKAATGAQRY